VLEAAKRFGRPAAARAWLEEHAAERMARSPELERELFSVKNTWPGESVTPVAAGTRTVGEALARIKAAEQPLLHWLCLSGLVQLAGAQRAAPAPAGEPRSPGANHSETPGVQGMVSAGDLEAAEGLFQRGEKLFAHAKWQEAASAFRQAIALNQAEAEFHAYLGMAMFRGGGNADEAVQLVQRALSMDPRLRSAALFLSRIHEARGDGDQAEAVLRDAVKKDPDFGEANSELARLRRSAPPQKKGLLDRLLKK
jgi:tetratricopeptide (TPR) repeat protein